MLGRQQLPTTNQMPIRIGVFVAFRVDGSCSTDMKRHVHRSFLTRLNVWTHSYFTVWYRSVERQD